MVLIKDLKPLAVSADLISVHSVLLDLLVCLGHITESALALVASSLVARPC